MAETYPVENVYDRPRGGQIIGYIQRINKAGMYRAFRLNMVAHRGTYSSRQAAIEAVRKAYG